MLVEAFGAIAALEQESLASPHAGKRPLQLARLAGEDQRRKAGELALHLGERGRVRIVRDLGDRAVSPAFGRPAVGGHLD